MNIATAPETGTRERVLRAVSQFGPITTAELSERLGLTDTAIRRHVDNLVEAELIAAHESVAPRRRGRPARAYVVSGAGHRALASDYADVATAALEYLHDGFGPEAVAGFARQRAAARTQRYAALLAEAADAQERAAALATALTEDGFDASLRTVGSSPTPSALTGMQLCQGHCPMQAVASQFPQFCDAETEAFGQLLGVHVQRLSTLAQGGHVCTTFIPLPATDGPSQRTDHPTHAEAS